jgi:hypothetical protein
MNAEDREALDDTDGGAGSGGGLRHELRKVLTTTSVNPSPVPYWGDAERHPNLAKLFEGRVQLVTAQLDGTPTRSSAASAAPGPATTITFVCTHHKAVVADPDAFSGAEDGESINGVHACALNGYLETLQVLIEEGGALPFKKARGGLDALMIARRRGHESVLEYLSTYEGRGGAQKLVKIQQRVAERRRREAAERALLEGDFDGGSQSSGPSMTGEEAQKMREEKAAVARAAALERSMLAIQQEEVKVVELLPRKIWRAEWAQIDDNRGVGFYPRKPFADG